jgi:cation transport regulator ChaB
MPMTDNNGNPIQEELPGTIQRSPDKAQRTFAKAHDSAAEEYGEGERAHRVAISALKHTFEKKGDHWEPKDGKGPSDPRAANPRARENEGESFGGVDVYGSSREELMKRAQDLDVQGRAKMTKEQLAQAIARKQD